jgi:hypothetical protein
MYQLLPIMALQNTPKLGYMYGLATLNFLAVYIAVFFVMISPVSSHGVSESTVLGPML